MLNVFGKDVLSKISNRYQNLYQEKFGFWERENVLTNPFLYFDI